VSRRARLCQEDENTHLALPWAPRTNMVAHKRVRRTG
jgi:hypothetical protein